MTIERANAFKILENRKNAFLDLFAGWSDERLGARPEGGWSALQVVEHLITSEHGTLAYLQKKTLAPAETLTVAGETEAQTARRLMLALKSDQKWEAPQVLAPPSGEFSLDRMSTMWHELRRGYEGLLQNLDPAYDYRLVFQHPVAGKLSLLQTLDFLEHHIQHHVHQIRRIVAQ